MTARIPEPLDMVRELALPHENHEPFTRESEAAGYVIWSSERHVTRVAPLLVQLEDSVGTQQTTGDSGGFAGGFDSKPVARLEVVDALEAIGQAVRTWLRRLDPNHAAPAETTAAVARLGGMLRQAPRCDRLSPGRRGREVVCCQRHQVEADVRRWWTTARVIVGWGEGAWAPIASCPMCGSGDQPLRVRFAERLGFCTRCHETWSGAAFDALGVHVRDQYWARSRDRLAERWCYCPVPNPIGATGSWAVGDRRVPLCTSCGSVRCHRALTAALAQPAAVVAAATA